MPVVRLSAIATYLKADGRSTGDRRGCGDFDRMPFSAVAAVSCSNPSIHSESHTTSCPASRARHDRFRMVPARATLQSRTILCGCGHRHFHRGAMPLGVRTFFGGTAHYRTERGAYAVDEDTWFIVNHQQPYAISVESRT